MADWLGGCGFPLLSEQARGRATVRKPGRQTGGRRVVPCALLLLLLLCWLGSQGGAAGSPSSSPPPCVCLQVTQVAVAVSNPLAAPLHVQNIELLVDKKGAPGGHAFCYPLTLWVPAYRKHFPITLEIKLMQARGSKTDTTCMHAHTRPTPAAHARTSVALA